MARGRFAHAAVVACSVTALAMSVATAGAQRATPPGQRFALGVYRVLLPTGNWVTSSDENGSLLTLTSAGSDGSSRVIEVRLRHISGDNFAASPVSTAQRMRDESRRVLEAKARSMGLRLVAARTDTTASCRALYGVRWHMTHDDSLRARAGERGVSYFWTPPGYRTSRRAVEFRWHAAGPGARDLDVSAVRDFHRVIESVRDSTGRPSPGC